LAPKKATAKKASGNNVAKPRGQTPSKRTPGKTARGSRQSSKQVAATRPVPQEERRIVSANELQAIRAFERALGEFNRQEFEAAKSSFEGILAKFGDQTDVVARSRTYLAICEQRLARTPAAPRNNPDALYNQGVFEFNRGNTREAIDVFRRALKASPQADHILYSLAAAYARAADPARAMDALRRAITMSPIHRSHARHDPDFSSLRGNREFQRLSRMPVDFSD
jgi:tetratricopeptide (TPR) repeat protein